MSFKWGEGGWETLSAATRDGKRTRWTTVFLTRREDRFFLWNDQGESILANLTPAGYEEWARAEVGLTQDELERLAERSLNWGFQVFSGQGFSRWSDLLVLPVPSESRVHICDVRSDARGFHVEVNDTPEAVFAPSRSSDLDEWQAVTAAQSSRDGFNLRFTDPAPPLVQALYEVRQAESPQGELLSWEQNTRRPLRHMGEGNA